MMDCDALWFWFHEAPGITRNTKHKLLKVYENPQMIFGLNEEKLSAYFRGQSNLERFLASRNEEQILNGFDQLEKKNIRFVHMHSTEYPDCFKEISDSPIGFYLKGNMPSFTVPRVAIIGARDCTRYGSEMARFFGRELGKASVQIISGLARGIDGMAHVGALEANAYTIGVLGCGIDGIYPDENYRIFMDMQEKGGILSEYGLGVKPNPGLFPHRNRLISALADGILVVEAMEKSGTFITVDQGLEQGKEIFALPGRLIDVKSRGCNELIRMGAHVVTEVNDILEILRVQNANQMKIADFIDSDSFVHKNLLAPNEKIVYSCLRVEPQYLDEIIAKAQIAPQEVCMALNRLAVIGGAVETTRNYYALKL
ncbi:MAG: DNA-protecting protein DprA [Lachnospiraceae bacterium]|nr:DNA-protecting protein DprA [Lachnospiraceae bacterium]